MFEKAKSVTCGRYWSFVVTEKGEVFGTGANYTGQLGLGHKKNVSKFTRVDKLIGIDKISAGHHTAALSFEGELFFWGTGVFGQILKPQRITHMNSKVTDISVGESFGLALDKHKKLWTWGANTLGELGTGNYEPFLKPARLPKLQDKPITTISCGGSFAIALGITRTQSATTNCIKLENKSEVCFKRSEVVCDSVSRDITSSVSLPDANNNLVVVLSKQRDYLEESLEKERRSREKLEENNKLLSAEI